jgi:hypothetical protein
MKVVKIAFSTAMVCFTIYSVLLTQPLFASTYTLNPTDDVYVSSDSPNYNYNSTGAPLKVGDYGIGTSWPGPSQYEIVFRTYLKFDLSSIQGTITSAELYLRYTSEGPQGTGISLYHVQNDSWGEGTLTWNNRPQFDNSPIASDSDLSGWKKFNLLGFALSDGYLSLMLKCSENGTYFDKRFYSSEASAGYRPYLNIVTSSSNVPLPSAVFFLASGLIGFVVVRRKVQS